MEYLLAMKYLKSLKKKMNRRNCDIKLSEDQEEILLLPPEHQTFPKLDIEEFETDLAKCSIKERWDTIRESRKREEAHTLKEIKDKIHGKFKQMHKT